MLPDSHTISQRCWIPSQLLVFWWLVLIFVFGAWHTHPSGGITSCLGVWRHHFWQRQKIVSELLIFPSVVVSVWELEKKTGDTSLYRTGILSASTQPVDSNPTSSKNIVYDWVIVEFGTYKCWCNYDGIVRTNSIVFSSSFRIGKWRQERLLPKQSRERLKWLHHTGENSMAMVKRC